MNLFQVLMLLISSVIYSNGQYTDNKDDFNIDTIGKEVSKVIQTMNPICLTNNNCYVTLWNFNNYCCVIQCCNMFQYIGRNEYTSKNVMEVVQNPRPINVFLIIVPLLLVTACLISVLTCCCCCCCRPKKYVYTNWVVRQRQEDQTTLIKPQI